MHFFASLFVLLNVIDLSNGLSLFLALGITLGFILQYLFDINSWSALAALPLLTLYTGLFTLGLATNAAAEPNQAARGVLGNAGFFCSMLVCIAGFWSGDAEPGRGDQCADRAVPVSCFRDPCPSCPPVDPGRLGGRLRDCALRTRMADDGRFPSRASAFSRRPCERGRDGGGKSPTATYNYYVGLQAALGGCSRVTVDLDDPFHEHFVETALADMGIRWSSQQPVWGYDRRGRDGIQNQVINPDCAITTRVRSIHPNHSVTAGRPRLEVLSRSRTIACRYACCRLINGRRGLAKVVPARSESSNWTKTVELPDFGTAPWLTIEVASDTHVLPGDTRALGAQLRLLSLER